MKLFKIIANLFQKNRSSCPAPSIRHEKDQQYTTSILTAPTFHTLQQRGTCYYLTGKRPFSKKGTLKKATIDAVFDFAYEMAFTDKHRNTRSGGNKSRTNGEIFANTFQGKIAECATCNFFYRYDNTVAPDFGTYEKGVWDSVDLSVCGKQIAVKSTKHFGQLLLLETKDWDVRGQYIPNIGTSICSYDYLLLVRITPSCEDLLKKERLLYSNQIDRNRLHQICCNQVWEYDYAGFITHSELIHIIREQHILPQGSLLNGNTRMDAENYYVQAIDMHPMNSLEDIFK